MSQPVATSCAGVVCIVDPYSSGNYFIAAARERFAATNVALVAVISSADTDKSLTASFQADKFDHIVAHYATQSVDQTVNAIRSLAADLSVEVLAVLPGSEPGVELCDSLTAAMGLRGNDSKTSHQRRNKYFMQEGLKEAGLPHIPQQLVASWVEAEKALASGYLSFPMVCKPVDSSGTDGVTKCLNVEQLKIALDRVLLHKNTSGKQNSVALLQEFVPGDEYVVDSVSFNGQHLLVSLWKYHKIDTAGGGFAYDLTAPVQYEKGGVGDRLFSYVAKCLSVLGINNGPSHSEVLFSPKGPVLVETGARMHGGVAPRLWADLIGEHSLPDLALDVLLVPAQTETTTETETESRPQFWTPRYQRQQQEGNPFTLVQACVQIDLKCFKTGRLRRSMEETCGHIVRALPSYWEHKFFAGTGDMVVPTVDMLTSPGGVHLAHPNPQQLATDLAKVRELEAGPMYVLEGEEEQEVVDESQTKDSKRVGLLSQRKQEWAGNFSTNASTAARTEDDDGSLSARSSVSAVSTRTTKPINSLEDQLAAMDLAAEEQGQMVSAA